MVLLLERRRSEVDEPDVGVVEDESLCSSGGLNEERNEGRVRARTKTTSLERKRETTDLGRNGSMSRVSEEDVLRFEIGVDETKSVEVWKKTRDERVSFVDEKAGTTERGEKTHKRHW